MSKKKIIATSVLSLAMCASLITGATYALFTSETETNIAINSGKVELVATIENIETYSAVADAAGAIVDENGKTYTHVLQENNIFANKGTVTEEEGEITLDKMTPGDKVTFEIAIANNSNVAIQYRTLITDADNGLLDALVVTIDGETYIGEVVDAWTAIEPNAEIAPVEVSIELPMTAGNEWQDKTVDLVVAVEAVQGNADMVQNPLIFDADTEYTLTGIRTNGSNGVLQATAGTLTINGNGTVNAEEGDDHYAMAVWANGGNVVINGGSYVQTFAPTDATYDLIYASNGGNITITGGTFKSVTPAWTLNVKDADRETSHITVMGGKFYQFDPSNAQTGEGEITVHEDYKVVQNGDWYEVVEKMEYTTIDSLADFVDFANAVTNNTSYKGYQVANNNYITASLTTDIDLTGVTGPAANANQFAIGNGDNTHFDGTFDGQGHTISNLTITGNWTYYRGLFRTVGGKFTMKNVIFDTVENISGVGVATTKTRNIGVIVGAVGGGEVTFENVTIKNAHVEGSYNTGLLFGRATAGKVNVINCKLENSVIETTYHIDEQGIWAGALFTSVDTTYGGCIGTISGNTVSNVTWKVVDSESETGMKDATSDLIGYRVDDVAYDINGNAK